MSPCAAFKLFLIGYFIENGSAPARSGEAEAERRRRTAGKQGRESYFRCYQTLWSPRAACFLCGGLRLGAYDWLLSNGQLLQIYRSQWTSQGQAGIMLCVFVFICLKVTFLFYLAAKALPHPDWSCCTTLTRCITTSLRVSPRSPVYQSCLSCAGR